MHWRSLPILTIVGMAVMAALARSADPPKQGQPPSAPSAPELVKTLWTVGDLVLDHDVDPPTRQEMMLGGIKAALQKAGAKVPADLSRRVSGFCTQEDFTGFVRECWPKAGDKSPSPEALTTAMLHGMLGRMPERPHLVPPKEVKVLEQVRDNRYVGTGIQIRMNSKENRCEIIDPFRGGPARKAGAKPGDLILKVDSKDTEGLSVAQVVDLIRGEEGTPVTFLVRQPAASETRTLNMVRGVVPFETVVGLKRGEDDAWVSRLQPNVPVAYLQITSITSSTLHELRQAAQKLQAADFRAVVLDMRETQGDSVQQAALLAAGLADGGVLWQVRDAKERVKEYRADRDCLFRDWPLAVLVSEHTGPAAGWVARALRNNRGTILVGDPARALPYARTLVMLPDNRGAVSLRTGVVEFPTSDKSVKSADGETSQDVIQPDHVVSLNPAQREAMRKWFFDKNLSTLPPGTSDAPPADPQVAKAVEVLQQALAKAAAKEKPEAPREQRP